MKKRLRTIKKAIEKKCSIVSEYYNDLLEYSRWQYNNPSLISQNALEAKILRQTHVIEKGMSLSEPRPKFGVQKAIELLDYIEALCSAGYKIENSVPVQNAVGVLEAYIKFHAEREFEPKNVISGFEKVKKYIPHNMGAFGIKHQKFEEIDKNIHSKFPEFFLSRHSVRQFANRPIDLNDIRKSVELAMHAPSACNRQSCKAYFYQDEEKNKEIGNLIAGNTGFSSDVRNYIVITSDMSAFYDSFERNQTYVDGGIFALALVEALHYHGIASCILQNGEYADKNRVFKRVCGNIPDNEKIILFIAIGYYKDDVIYATSHRKTLDNVLIVE